MTERNTFDRTQGMNYATEYLLYGSSLGLALAIILSELLFYGFSSYTVSMGIVIGMAVGALIGGARDRRIRKEYALKHCSERDL